MQRNPKNSDIFTKTELNYMNDLAAIAISPFLSNKQILEYISSYRETQDQKYLNLIIRNYIKLLIRKARKYKRAEVDIGDLIHYGIDGLIEAVDWSYKLTKKEKFITYITIIIERRMKDGLDTQKGAVKFPKNIMTQQRKARHKATAVIDSVITKNKSKSDIIYSKLNINDFKEFEIYTFRDNPNIQEDSIELILDRESLQFDVYRVLEGLLNRIERDVIIHSFGLNGESSKAFDAIGLLLNLSAQKIRKIHSSALLKIKSNLKSQEILKKYIT